MHLVDAKSLSSPAQDESENVGVDLRKGNGHGHGGVLVVHTEILQGIIFMTTVPKLKLYTFIIARPIQLICHWTPWDNIATNTRLLFLKDNFLRSVWLSRAWRVMSHFKVKIEEKSYRDQRVDGV